MVSDNPWSRDYWLGEVDARSTALVRIGFALALLIDWLDRLRDFRLFYSDEGIFPLGVIPPSPWLFNLPSGLLFAAGLLAILALLLGWHARLAAVACWLYVNLLQARNPFILDGADAVLRVAAFWLLWIDAGGRWSLDAELRPRVGALGLRALELQIAFIYLWAASEKSGASWRNLNALFQVFQLNDFARPLGMALLNWPRLCRGLTAGALGVEWSFLFLVYCPWLWRRTRFFAVAAALALHLGIFATLRVGLFSLVMPLLLLAFIPQRWWGCVNLPHTARPSVRRRAARFIPPLLIAAQLAAAAWMMLGQRLTLPPQPTLLRREVSLLGLSTRWTMFAPEPRQLDGYWEIRGDARDLIAALPGLREEGELWFSRWFSFRSNLADDARLQQLVGDYLCRDSAASQVRLDYHFRSTRAPGAPSQPYAPARPLSVRCPRPRQVQYIPLAHAARPTLPLALAAFVGLCR